MAFSVTKSRNPKKREIVTIHHGPFECFKFSNGLSKFLKAVFQTIENLQKKIRRINH